MKTILKFEKFVLANELNEKFRQVGGVFEIANVLDDAFVLRDEKTKVAVGVVNFEDFEKHFVRVENFKGWTAWTPLVGFDGQTDCFYRTNFKKVQVKFLTDKVRGEAACSKEDNFNLYFGINMAYMRCHNKALFKQKAELEEKLRMINHEIGRNDNTMERMVDSLVV